MPEFGQPRREVEPYNSITYGSFLTIYRVTLGRRGDSAEHVHIGGKVAPMLLIDISALALGQPPPSDLYRAMSARAESRSL